MSSGVAKNNRTGKNPMYGRLFLKVAGTVMEDDALCVGHYCGIVPCIDMDNQWV